ncbi:12447_t:CDS:1 [Funneliformis mosseae]|uniref:12447_t:CDS:1 n=1 Tax=Funneliformis mosseae TaxID=27381 RepID=A0A9N8ZRC8_FUNMO|nr:12447_t:CDS:1 [Funneliformis mosseae]
MRKNYCVVCKNPEVLTNKKTGEELKYCSKKCRKVSVKNGLLEACINCGIYPKLLEYDDLLEYCDDDCKLELNKTKPTTTQKKSNDRRKQDSGYGEDDDLPPTYYPPYGLNKSPDYTYYHNDFENEKQNQTNHSLSSSYSSHYKATSTSSYANESYSAVPAVAPTPQIIYVHAPPPPPQIIHIHHNHIPPQPNVYPNHVIQPHNNQNGKNSTMNTVAKIGGKIALSVITGGISDIITGQF